MTHLSSLDLAFLSKLKFLTNSLNDTELQITPLNITTEQIFSHK